MLNTAVAQDLPDPGRRLSKEELTADPEKPSPRKAEPALRQNVREAEACERARTNYQLSCGAPYSRRSHSMECGTAYALYRQSCP
jgi:hypothetical protein